MKKKIIRKDGIEYERNARDVICDNTLTLRIPTSTLIEFKEITLLNGIKCNTMARNLIEEYIKKEKKKLKRG